MLRQHYSQLTTAKVDQTKKRQITQITTKEGSPSRQHYSQLITSTNCGSDHVHTVTFIYHTSFITFTYSNSHIIYSGKSFHLPFFFTFISHSCTCSSKR